MESSVEIIAPEALPPLYYNAGLRPYRHQHSDVNESTAADTAFPVRLKPKAPQSYTAASEIHVSGTAARRASKVPLLRPKLLLMRSPSARSVHYLRSVILHRDDLFEFFIATCTPAAAAYVNLKSLR